MLKPRHPNTHRLCLHLALLHSAVTMRSQWMPTDMIMLRKTKFSKPQAHLAGDPLVLLDFLTII